MSPLEALILGPHNDSLSLQDRGLRHQDMLDQRGATTYRNVGPHDLMNFPDKNSYKPEDVMRQLYNMGDQEEMAAAYQPNQQYAGQLIPFPTPGSIRSTMDYSPTISSMGTGEQFLQGLLKMMAKERSPPSARILPFPGSGR